MDFLKRKVRAHIKIKSSSCNDITDSSYFTETKARKPQRLGSLRPVKSGSVETESPLTQQPSIEMSLCSQNRALCSLTRVERHLENEVWTQDGWIEHMDMVLSIDYETNHSWTESCIPEALISGHIGYCAKPCPWDIIGLSQISMREVLLLTSFYK